MYDLPEEILLSLLPRSQPLLDSALGQQPDLQKDGQQNADSDLGVGKTAASCNLCRAAFTNFTDQREHMRSDWHRYNLKRKVSGSHPLSEGHFERLLEESDISISASEGSSSEEEDLAAARKNSGFSNLFKRRALSNSSAVSGSDIAASVRPQGGAPLLWFSSPLLQPQMSLGFYKALFTRDELDNNVSADTIRKKQVRSVPIRGGGKGSRNTTELSRTAASPNIFLCMIGGGHFAGMIVSLAQNIVNNASGLQARQPAVILHKTFHRYTTRRKQGGAQSANDSSKGNAHSAGASIRRYNEAALESEVRGLLAEWKPLIQECELLFVRATGNSNRKILFGPYDGQVLRYNDTRIRSFPFSTRRATQSELMRAFVELTRVKISEKADLPPQKVEEASNERSLLKTARNEQLVPLKPERPKEEEEAAFHTSQLQALIRRSKAPALMSYLESNSLSPNFAFFPPASRAHHHSPTLLHLAASINSDAVVLALLTKAGADPTLVNGENKVPFELSGERHTRDAFRIARSELGENVWDWQKAQCPPPLTKAEVERKYQIEKAKSQKTEEARRKVEMARLEQSQQVDKVARGSELVQTLKAQGMTAEARRELEGRGLTPEMRATLERERRARAAEERMKRIAGG